MSYARFPLLVSLFVMFSFSTALQAANLEEGWEKAKPDTYSPGSIIKGDAGNWVIDATIDGTDDCGPVPHQIEIIASDGNRLLQLNSGESTQGCSDNVWAVLFTKWGAPVNNNLTIPITPNSIFSFELTGHLDNPEKHGWGYNCLVPPCYDNISVHVEDTNGNIVAYVLDRYADAPPQTDDHHYREIHLDPEAEFYSRNLYDDLSVLPNFKTGNSKVYSIMVTVDEHGWCEIDNIKISDGNSGEPTAGSCDLSCEFGQVGLPAAIIAGQETKVKAQILVTNEGDDAVDKGAKMTVVICARPEWAGDDATFDIELLTQTNVSVSNLKPGKTKKINLNIVLPADITEDEYYLVAKIDADNDISESDEGNNTAQTMETSTISAPFVDLAPALMNPTLPNSVVSGDGTKIKLPMVIFNNGNVPCEIGQTIDITILARPSDNLGDSSQDVILLMLSDVSISNLKPEKFKKLNIMLYLPPGMEQGDYVLGAMVDSANELEESAETNNLAITPLFSVEPGHIDLIGSIDKTKLPSSILEGTAAKGTIQVAVTNMGNVAVAKGQKIKMRIIAKSTVTQQEWDLVPINKQFLTVSNLKPGAAKKYNGNVVIPESLPNGSYQIIVTVDSDQDVTESNESNNTVNELSLNILSAAQQLVGTWEVIKIQGAPGKVDGSNSTWTFNSNGSYSWYLIYQPYYNEWDSGNYSFNGQTLSVTGGLKYGLFDGKPVHITFKNDTFSFKDHDGDKWTYKKVD